MKRQAFFLFVSSYISSATDEWDAALKKQKTSIYLFIYGAFKSSNIKSIIRNSRPWGKKAASALG